MNQLVVAFVIKQWTRQSTRVTRLRHWTLTSMYVSTCNGTKAQRHKTAYQYVLWRYDNTRCCVTQNCLTTLYTRHRSLSRKTDTGTNDNIKLESGELAELMSYMEDWRQYDHPVGSIFKLSHLVKLLYTQSLEQLGADQAESTQPH